MLRSLLAACLLALWCVGCVLLARATSSPAVDVLAAVLLCVPLCSLFEWLVHGVLYHRGVPGLGFIRTIHLAHHAALFPPQRYVHEGAHSFMCTRPLQPYRMARTTAESFFTAACQVALHFAVGVPAIVLPAWFLSGGELLFTQATIAVLALISWGLAYVHGCIHTPRARFVERQRFFQWLDRHHYIHHVDMRANLNFGLPLCDVLFGTRKPTMSVAEAARHPSFEAAKPMALDVPRA